MLSRKDLKQILSDVENVAMNHIIDGIELGDDDVIRVYTDDTVPVEIDLFPFGAPQQVENICPVCGYDDMDGEGFDVDGVWAKQECTCVRCGTVFINKHRLTQQDIIACLSGWILEAMILPQNEVMHHNS